MPDTPEQQPPSRRRGGDGERRRWTDRALDILGQRVASHANDIGDLNNELRVLTRLPSEMAAMRRELDDLKHNSREDVTEIRADIRELREENRLQHRRVAYGKDPDDGAVTLPPATVNVRRTVVDKAKDMALIVSLLLIPILAAYVAAAGR